MDKHLRTALKIANGADIKIPGALQFGRLRAFSQDELGQLESLRDLIVRYLTGPSPERPLCLALFGSPGSGKTFAAKELCSEAKAAIQKTTAFEKLNLPLTVVNMTQVGSAVDVARVLARIAGEQKDETVPVVLFDEFDASRAGAPYGWLSWFLAPMHDGEFLHEGATIRLQRAIYLFAGGTADNMESFSTRPTTEFSLAKGPDFVSRLRGYLDVQGPNEHPREIRRAIIFCKELESRLKRSTTHDRVSHYILDRKMLVSLLCAGRYRHGARSIAAIIEMSGSAATSRTWSWEMLPENHILKLHVDRGPLDAERIGGPIALSGYTSRLSKAVEDCWASVADALWNEGATLSYVWPPSAYGANLMRTLAGKLRTRPVEPKRRSDDRRQPKPWLEGYMTEDMSMRRVNKVIARAERTRCGLHVIPQKRLDRAERRQLAGDKWKIGMLSRFRRRFAMSEASVARFAVDGWTTGYKGRVPGIAEEVMLTLAFNRPVYIAGGFGGAAADLGILLGLSQIRTGAIPPSFVPQGQDFDLNSIADKLRPPPLNKLPVASTDVVAFLRAHALGGSAWPNNGLSWSDNRRLFASTDPKEVATLVVRGLRRVFRVR
jgi:hypothetical protein